MSLNQEIGARVEIHCLQERYHKGKLAVASKDDYDPLEDDPTGVYALVYRQRFLENGKLEIATLKINSPSLLGAFREVIGYHPQCPFGFEAPIEIEAPFMILYHNWAELQSRRTQTDNDNERLHLGLLLDFMNSEMGNEREKVERMIKNSRIDFSTLWTIFKPGDLMYRQIDENNVLLKLEKTNYEESDKTGRRFEVHCTNICNNGTDLQRILSTIIVYEKQNFGGGSFESIMSLPVFPLKYSNHQKDGFFEQLEDRGRKCERLAGIAVKNYTGMATIQKTPPLGYYSPDEDDYGCIWRPFKESGRIVVDAKTYFEDYAAEGGGIQRIWPQDFIDWADKIFGSLQRAKYILCSPDIHGFSLQRKEWCKYYVDHVEEILWNENAITQLMIPDRSKSVLEALVSSHRFSQDPRETFEQKGKGLIILLHGTPGSGKTLTAEVAAEISRCPLLRISLGDLYERSWFEEVVLEEFLKYAVIWKAVVLFDEADVFLERRTSGENTNAQRNALVAGSTILTWQCKFYLHRAFISKLSYRKSRIHLALQYSPPTDELRRQLWESQLTDLPQDTIDLDIPTTLDFLVRAKMNGREISNSTNTALTLARHAKTKLKLEHLRTVVEVWEEFNKDLEVLARKRKTTKRQDSFVPDMKSTVFTSVTEESRWTDPI